jgi:hypothetical protein
MKSPHVDSVERWRDYKTETWYPEQKNHVYDHIEPARLPSCRQALKWYQNGQQLFCSKNHKFAWTCNLSSRKGGTAETTCDSCRQLLGSRKSGFDILAPRIRQASYVTPVLFTWFGSSDFCLFHIVKNSKGFRYIKKTSFSSACKQF